MTENPTTKALKEFWAYREKLRCEGKSTTCIDREPTNHDKHKPKCLPKDFGNLCVIKPCHPHHRQLRFPENMGLADPHYVACRTRRQRRPTLPLEKNCCHGDDYETDSDDEEGEDCGKCCELAHNLTTSAKGYLISMKSYLPAYFTLFVLWMFLMNYVIYGNGPAVTDR